jgi:2-dehydro-3-deoxyphosphogluconate aldolase/(4S)-4-hydroxy-2-oxoglutarate aldolase
MSREAINERVREMGLVPVVRAPSADDAVSLATALFDGGVRCLEITMTVPDGPSVIERLRQRLGAEALVGAGTVTSQEMAATCLNSGAEFIVSPATIPGLVKAAHAGGAPAMIGALTPTEVLTAWQAGSDVVKVFPCSALGGASYLKALRGPFPQIPLMPTGGVSLDTMSDYLGAGAVALGVGSNLANFKLLSTEGKAAVVELARRYASRLAEFRAATE